MIFIIKDESIICIETAIYCASVCVPSCLCLSGFYDLSDEASVSLSNSSNSVFSECFCSFTEADGGVLSAGIQLVHSQ